MRKNSKNKNQTASPFTLTITLHLSTKTVVLKAPMPCPATTLHQLIHSEIQSPHSKIAYYQTINSDWITDYKIQSGTGWIRHDCHLRCVLKKKTQECLSGIEAYSILKCIGVGGFSKVYLARDKIDGTFYAAKFIEKEKIRDKQDLIVNQKYINEKIEFPFLVHMKDFIVTDLYYIMIMEYCPGGELFNLQRKVIRFDQQSAKKYFLQVLLAIQYLHSRSIIYRDLKPENIMLDIKGHIKIADFGLAKQTVQKRYSFCGSLQYMSPEVLARVGHSFEVDYYCMGALLYQMVVGCPPFYQPNSPDALTKQRILKEEVYFPTQIGLSQNVKGLIRLLLEKDPKRRLGHLGGTKQIKCHPWIGWINRSQWLSGAIDMPYPVNLDTFNFDCQDITASAQRMLTNIHAECKSLSKKTSSCYLKKPEKLLSPYRQNTQVVNKPKRNLSNEKCRNKSSNGQSNSKKKKGGNSKSKENFNSIKACYVSTSKTNLSKFLRYPTETDCKFRSKQKQRKSYYKQNTQCKQNQPHRSIRKRKPREEFNFMQAKRN